MQKVEGSSLFVRTLRSAGNGVFDATSADRGEISPQEEELRGLGSV
jgi:hypothetical protein